MNIRIKPIFKDLYLYFNELIEECGVALYIRRIIQM